MQRCDMLQDAIDVGLLVGGSVNIHSLHGYQELNFVLVLINLIPNNCVYDYFVIYKV